MEKETHLLEINLISAQGLKPPTANLRRLQTYAIAWVDPAFKLRTRTDTIGAENPTWNEKFLFRVSSRFLNGETSAVSVEIYAVGFINDPLIGTVRFLLNSHLSSAASGVGVDSPAFTAVHVRRPSGRFQGVLNIAVTILDGLEFGAVAGSSPAICFRDLMEKSRRRRRNKGTEKSDGESCDFSDGGESTTSSSSSTASTALKEWNWERGEKKAGKDGLATDGGGLLCGLVKAHLRPYDHNLRFLAGSQLHKEN